MSTATSPQSSPQVLTGRTLRMARKAHGLGLRELAELVGVSASHLSRVESGQRIAGNELLVRIAETLADLPAAEASA